MKRSEMIDLLGNLLKDDLGLLGECRDEEAQKELEEDSASKILAFLEYKGMTPPSYDDNKYTACSEQTKGGYCCAAHHYYPDGFYVNKWEEE